MGSRRLQGVRSDGSLEASRVERKAFGWGRSSWGLADGELEVRIGGVGSRVRVEVYLGYVIWRWCNCR